MSITAPAIVDRRIAPPGRWTVDPIHSSVEFAVKHLAIATVKGRFREFEGALEVDDAGGVRGHGRVKVETLDSGDLRRDSHLLSSDFFDVDRYPEIASSSESSSRRANVATARVATSRSEASRSRSSSRSPSRAWRAIRGEASGWRSS